MTDSFIVLVCGGRDYRNREAIQRTFTQLIQLPSVLVHGGCRGADMMSEEVYREVLRDVDKDGAVRCFPAQWGKYGQSAGPIRNQAMLDETLPHLIVAFHSNLKESKGTLDMVTRGEKAGIPILRIL